MHINIWILFSIQVFVMYSVSINYYPLEDGERLTNGEQFVHFYFTDMTDQHFYNSISISCLLQPEWMSIILPWV